MDHPMMGKPTPTTKERATGNYIRPASPLPNAQQHSVERRRQTGTQEGKREQQDERGAPAARRDVDVEAGGALWADAVQTKNGESSGGGGLRCLSGPCPLGGSRKA